MCNITSQKSFDVYRNSNGIVTVTFTRGYSRMSHIHVTEADARKAFDEVLPHVKRWHNLVSVSMGYEDVDTRDEDCDVSLTVQDATWIKGQNKVKADIAKRQIHFLPKAWNKYFIIKLDNPKSISYIKKFAAMFGIQLTAGQQAKLRKTLAGGPGFTWDNYCG